MIWTHSALVRAHQIVAEVVQEKLQLDLHGCRVITEAATGPFAVTAAIAAMAGAQVEAIAHDSSWGTADEAARGTLAVARQCKVAEAVRIVDRAAANVESADIITNLGAVRPLDSSAVERMKTGAVIPLMYDARETRPDDIDLEACERTGVKVIGTNEDHPLVDVLRYSGHLVAKMCLEQNIEILRSRLVVLGDNLFTPHVVSELHSMGAHISFCRSWKECRETVSGPLDALINVDYWNRMGELHAGEMDGWLSQHAGACLVQFVGGLDISSFVANGWRVVPDRELPAQRMWRTLGDLGIRPVIELHAAGLKAAELEWKNIPLDSSGRLGGLRQRVTSETAHFSPHLGATVAR